MKTWIAPEVQELDVKLTAKISGTTEALSHGPDWPPATFNSATTEWNETGNCHEPIKTSTAS